MRKLPKSFILGGATAAYQAEGATHEDGKGEVAWDAWLKKQGRFQAEPASDFYHQYPQDLKLSHEFGVDAIRVSIAWSRIFPNGDDEKPNEKGVEFYHKLFASCKENHVIPFVTLHHFDTPATLFNKGDFLNRHTIDAFVRYAKFCFKEFENDVDYWFTFNEVWPVSQGQYLTGAFPPGIRFDYGKLVQSLHNMMYAHAKALIAFKEGHYKGQLGIIQSLETRYPYRKDNPEDQKAAKMMDALTNKFVLDAGFLGEYQPDTWQMIQDILKANDAEIDIPDSDFEVMKKAAPMLDYLGINQYQSSFIKAYDGPNDIHHNGTGAKGTSVFRLHGVGEVMYDVDVPRTDWDWFIYPKGLYDMLMRIKHDYPNYKAIYITENGMGYKDDFVCGEVDDTPRIKYLAQYLDAVAHAIEDGVNVKGYFVWSLMDVFSWSNGYNKRYGLFYVDFDTQKRYPKKSAYWWRKLSSTHEIVIPK